MYFDTEMMAKKLKASDRILRVWNLTITLIRDQEGPKQILGAQVVMPLSYGQRSNQQVAAVVRALGITRTFLIIIY